MRNIKINKICKMHIKSIQEGKILQDVVIPVTIKRINNISNAIEIEVWDENKVSYSLIHTQKEKGILSLLKKDKFFSCITNCGNDNYIQFCIY